MDQLCALKAIGEQHELLVGNLVLPITCSPLNQNHMTNKALHKTTSNSSVIRQQLLCFTKQKHDSIQQQTLPQLFQANSVSAASTSTLAFGSSSSNPAIALQTSPQTQTATRLEIATTTIVTFLAFAGLVINIFILAILLFGKRRKGKMSSPGGLPTQSNWLVAQLSLTSLLLALYCLLTTGDSKSNQNFSFIKSFKATTDKGKCVETVPAIVLTKTAIEQTIGGESLILRSLIGAGSLAQVSVKTELADLKCTCDCFPCSSLSLLANALASVNVMYLFLLFITKYSDQKKIN